MVGGTGAVHRYCYGFFSRRFPRTLNSVSIELQPTSLATWLPIIFVVMFFPLMLNCNVKSICPQHRLVDRSSFILLLPSSSKKYMSGVRIGWWSSCRLRTCCLGASYGQFVFLFDHLQLYTSDNPYQICAGFWLKPS